MPTTTNVDGLLRLMKQLQGEKPQREFARSLKISPQYLCDVYSNRTMPGPKMLEAMGITSNTQYVIPDKINASYTASLGELNANEESSAKENRKEIKASRRRKR